MKLNHRWSLPGQGKLSRAAVAAALGLIALGGMLWAPAGSPAAFAASGLINPNGVTLTQDFPEGEHEFVVPQHTIGGTLNVTAIGASGLSGGEPSACDPSEDDGVTPGSGGEGAEVTGTLTEPPGTTLYVYVGGQGTYADMTYAGQGEIFDGTGGFNGGGAGGAGGTDDNCATNAYGGVGGPGGGASDVRTCQPGAGCPALGSADDPRLIVAAGGGGGGGAGDGDILGLGTTRSCEPGFNGGGAGQAGTGDGTIVVTGGGAGVNSDGLGGNGGNPTSTGVGGGGGGGGGYDGGGGGTAGSTGGAAGGGGGSNLVPPGGTATLTTQPSQVKISFTLPDVFLSGQAGFTAGQAGSFTIQVAGEAASLSESGPLPSWLTFTDNGDNTATVAGTPPAGDEGVGSFTVTASNASGVTATEEYNWSIAAPPSFTSPATATFIAGQHGTFGIDTNGNPVPALSTAWEGPNGRSPQGISIINSGEGTAALTGTPPAGLVGEYQLEVTAANSLGFVQQPLTVNVVAGGSAAYQAANGDLAVGTADDAKSLGLAMAAGTSPSITDVPGGYEIAYQAANGDLAVAGADGTSDLGLAMMAGTSPSITAVSGGYEIAYQAPNGDLAVTGADGSGDLGLGMMAGTSPSITAVSGGYQIAFQANTGILWTAGADGTTDLDLGMMAGTSPAITVANGEYYIAFQANTGILGINTNGQQGQWDNTGEHMMAGTSPAITHKGGGYLTAFQTSSGTLGTYYDDDGPAVPDNTGIKMAAGTSPAAAAMPATTGNVQIAPAQLAFQTSSGTLGFYDNTEVDTGTQMKAGTSPGMST